MAGGRGIRQSRSGEILVSGCLTSFAAMFFNLCFLFLLRYPMLRWTFCNHASGALEALPCVGMEFDLFYIRFFRHGYSSCRTGQGQAPTSRQGPICAENRRQLRRSRRGMVRLLTVRVNHLFKTRAGIKIKRDKRWLVWPKEERTQRRSLVAIPA